MANAQEPALQLVWLDQDVFNEENSIVLRQLREITNRMNEFKDKDECKRLFHRGILGSNRCLVIVSGRLGEEFVALIHHRVEISAIYVYCRDRQRAEQWSAQYSKVTDRFTFVLRMLLSIKVKVIIDPTELIETIRAEKESFDKR